MIQHFVIWRLNEQAKGPGRAQLLQDIRQCFAQMRTQVPGLLHLELGVNQDTTADAADLMLNSRFDSWESLRAYGTHPLHDELRKLIGPVRIERRIFDYEI